MSLENLEHFGCLNLKQLLTKLRPKDILWAVKALISLFLLLTVTSSRAEDFSFHMFGEPRQLDPQPSASASSSYVFVNIFRGLYRYRGDRGLMLEGAKACRRKDKTLLCELRENFKWSDGKPITAEDYIYSFRKLIQPGFSPNAELLFNIKNAREIWAGKLPVEKLGVTAPTPSTLQFVFSESDPEFEYKLIHPALAPQRKDQVFDVKRANQLFVSGPYKIENWISGKQLRLIPNPHYREAEQRPPVSVFFIDDDSTALRLYEAGKINFLRRVVAADVARFRNSPEMKLAPMARFDYIGFGPELKDQPEIRKALVLGVDFTNFKEIFFSTGLPGCPSLPESLLDKPYCQTMNVPEAKRAYAAAKLGGHKISWQFAISQMGGEDITRGAEWFQGQWSKNLGLRVPIQSREQASYLQLLKSHPPTLFRKGVGLDRPTCAAALELFTKNHPENYIQFQDPKFDLLVKRMQATKSSKARQKMCRAGVEILLKGNWLIPLGPMHFTLLVKPNFTGWHLNELNQLDLTDLRPKAG